MMAWQVAAKTARDGLFLSVFPARALPRMVLVASVCSILLAVLNARLLRRHGPFRLIPAGFLLSGGLHAAEWALRPMFPRPVSAIVYVHVLSLGAVLLSGFWTLANEQFDPRQARKRFGRIAGYGTLGGLAGGLVAERVVALFSTAALLPLLMVLQVVCGIVLLGSTPPRAARRPAKAPRVKEMIAKAPYLVGIAWLMVLVSVAATTLDFLFKSQAVEHFGRGEPLSRFFAVFYTATSFVSFLAQAGASRMWLDRFGLGRTVATLPTGVAGACLLALLAPGTIVLSLARGVEQVLRGSLFRSGYELFFTPMPEAEKRTAKSVIDIGADRLGDGLGAAAVQLLLVLPAGAATYAILTLTAVVSGVGTWLSFRLDRAYGAVLRKKLAESAMDLRHIEVEDATTRTIVNAVAPAESGQGAAGAPRGTAGPAPPPPAWPESRKEALAVLQSSDSRAIKETLRDMGLLDPVFVPQAILLLGHESVWRAAHDALQRTSFRIAGQLVDALLDPTLDQQVRLRIPRLLTASGTRLAWTGLFQGLDDPDFEIRCRCARALDFMFHSHSEFRPEPAAVYRIIGKELAAHHAEWQNRPNIEVSDGLADPTVLNLVVRKTVSRSLAHVFVLLGLVLPREAVQTAFRALHTDDQALRSLALEYIESAVPRELRERLSAHIEGPRPTKTAAPTRQLLDKLLAETPSIMARLRDSKPPDSPGKPGPRPQR